MPRPSPVKPDLVYVGFCALLLAVLGVYAIVDPVAALAPVGLRADGPVGVVELRAVYGGLELGITGFLVWCMRTGRFAAAVVACTLCFGCLGVVRASSWLAAGMPASLHPWFVLLELVVAVLGTALWRRAAPEAR